ncbi:AMP-binding protein, partial [Streptomyces sp. SID8455]|nr:AMP-binding protein [Streptomyces sp. SID8455]
IERYRISAMSAVPTVYSVLAHVPVDADISSMRFAAVGASALPDTVRTAFTANTGVELCEGYGLTEATCATARSFTGHDHRPGSVGQRL